MGWWVPANRLKDDQRRYINEMVTAVHKNDTGIFWVKGFAGTGKTTVLTHLAVTLKNDRKGKNESFCYITYTHALKELAHKTLLNENKGGFMKEMTHTKFLVENRPYDFVFLDEVQDIRPRDLERIKTLSRFLFIAGDCEQSIYNESPKEEDIDRIYTPKKLFFWQILRLTKCMADIAKSILPSSKINEGDPKNTNGDSSINIYKFKSQQEEFDWIENEAKNRASPGSPSCILFSHHFCIEDFFRYLQVKYNLPIANGPFDPKNRDVKRDRYGNEAWSRLPYKQLNGFFKYHKIPFSYLGNDIGSLSDSDRQPLVYVMTFHSSKGLDFENVFIPQMNDNKEIVFDKILEKNPGLDQRLLFVAVTRSRKELYISHSTSKPHSYINNLPKGTYAQIDKTICQPQEQDDYLDDNEEFGDFF